MTVKWCVACVPFVLLIVGLVGGCVKPGGTVVTGMSGNDVTRYIDDEAGVVCWLYRYKGGISCLPISDTKLDR